MIQAQTLDKYFFCGLLLPFHPLLFWPLSFLVVFFYIFSCIFLVVYFSLFFSFFFLFFFRFDFLSYLLEHFNNSRFTVQQNIHYWSSGSGLSVLFF